MSDVKWEFNNVQNIVTIPIPPFRGHAGKPLVSMDLDSLAAFWDLKRHHLQTVVAAGGCFDLWHAGHADLLTQAAHFGDGLIVLLNSDASVKRIKPNRPILPVELRAIPVLSHTWVCAVFVFEEETPEAILEVLKPDVWVKGSDWAKKEIPEQKLIESYGGRIELIVGRYDISTTEIVNKALLSRGFNAYLASDYVKRLVAMLRDIEPEGDPHRDWIKLMIDRDLTASEMRQLRREVIMTEFGLEPDDPILPPYEG